MKSNRVPGKVRRIKMCYWKLMVSSNRAANLIGNLSFNIGF